MSCLEKTDSSEAVSLPISFVVSIRPKSSSILNLNQKSRYSSTKMLRQKSYSMDDIFDGDVRRECMTFMTMSDCVPSPDSDSSYASSTGSHSSTGSSSSPTCEISLLERLIRTHPVWFLPSLQRSGALHLLQGRDVGNFIVRSSTQPMTMAVSVKLPGNHVEHYLLKAVDNRIALENSTHTFETVHQLIAHYCGISDEIPVCLRVPSAIAEATSRQQLRSLALLGQEFWTHSSSGSGKELSSPSDIEISKNFVSSGLGSQSSSSQNSLCDVNRKPCRPTTLELGTSGGGGNGIATPPPVPPRWSRSALLTPLSLPSSVQSTPSEVQSTFSEKSGRPGKKKKRNSGGNKAESIHYKDTEILQLDMFKGKKTSYEDKASDYEDLWSPNHQDRSHTPRLSTFKPELIASSRGSDLDNSHNVSYNGKSPSQNHPAHRNENQFQSLTLAINNSSSKEDVDVIVQNKNVQNHRLSFNGQNSNQISHSEEKGNKGKSESKESLDKSKNKKNSGVYSEPVDSIAFRRLSHHRHSEPNIRWSQPLLSLVKVELGGSDENECTTPTEVSGKGGSGVITQHRHNQIMSSSFHAPIHQHQLFNQHHRSSLANVNVSPNGNSGNGANNNNNNNHGKPVVLNRNSNGSIHSQRNHSLACASMDNLCHLRDIKKRAKKYSCSGESGDDERPLKKEATEAPKVPAKPKKKSDMDKERREEREMLDISNNKSWRLDNSWEFVMLESRERDDEQRLADVSAKFPLTNPPNSPFLMDEGMVNGFGLGLGMEGGLIVRPNRPSAENNSSSNSHNEDSLNSTHKTSSGFNSSNSNINRFSRYDNLESVKTEDENSGDEFHTEGEVEEKISTPWDSSKWEHLLRLVSESTQQLDSLQMAENNLNNRRNLNLFNGDRRFIAGLKDIDERHLSTDSRQRVSKILEVSGNVDKASKAISSVVRELSEKENGVFGPTLKSFISCTIAAKIQDPHKVMRNVRQFISGMKNYLVGVSGESTELRTEIKKQTEILSDCEFLNIDAILEEVLVHLVISPLNLHIRGLIEAHHMKNEEPLKLNKLASSSLLRGDKNSDTKSHLPNQQDIHKQEIIDKLKKIYVGLEDSVSPIKKLDKWNEFVCQVQDMENYSSESFLPLLAEMLGSVCTVNLPSHVDYMIGLLPHSLAEQNNYSLSLLQSAVSALRAKSDCRKGSSTLTSVRVIVPDERNGTLIRKMVPVRETTTNREVAKMVASKLGIANTGDYVLVRIKNGEEKLCPESELVSQFVEDSATALAYKRIDAKIGWPQKIS